MVVKKMARTPQKGEKSAENDQAQCLKLIYLRMPLKASVRKNVSRLLQQFPGLKVAEEPSALDNIMLHIPEVMLNCLNSSTYDVQCS